MNRRQFLALSSAGVAATVAGCVSSADEDDGNLPSGGSTTGDDYGEIEVSATGTAETEPDRAVARIGVEARGETADDVRADLADGSDALRATFEDLGIPEDNVRTATFRINERRQESGFEGVHAFSVEVDDVDRIGEVIDAAVDAGADDVGRVNFTLQDETRKELRDDALDDALANADSEAEHIANNRGVEIVATQSISTTDVSFGPVRTDALEYAVDDADAGGQTELDSGPVTVTATVAVVYRFEQ